MLRSSHLRKELIAEDRDMRLGQAGGGTPICQRKSSLRNQSESLKGGWAITTSARRFGWTSQRKVSACSGPKYRLVCRRGFANQTAGGVKPAALRKIKPITTCLYSAADHESPWPPRPPSPPRRAAHPSRAPQQGRVPGGAASRCQGFEDVVPLLLIGH